MTTTTLTKENFNDFLNSDKPVLIDFWAPWCGPCKVLGPVIEEIASEYGDKIQVAKLNVDDNPEIAGQFAIRGIPTVKIFKEGKEVHSTSGAYPKDYWQKLIDGM